MCGVPEPPRHRLRQSTARRWSPSAGRASARIASRGTRSWSSNSVALTRGSAWNRVTKMSSCSTLASATSDIPWWCAKKARTISGLTGRRPSSQRRLQASAAGSRLIRRTRIGRRAPARVKPRQVRGRRRRIDEGSERGGVRRHDQFVGKTALQSEAGHAKRLVLIVAGEIGERVGRLGDAPRHASLFAVLDLPAHTGVAALVEQRARIRCASAAAASGTRTSCRPTT